MYWDTKVLSRYFVFHDAHDRVFPAIVGINIRGIIARHSDRTTTTTTTTFIHRNTSPLPSTPRHNNPTSFPPRWWWRRFDILVLRYKMRDPHRLGDIKMARDNIRRCSRWSGLPRVSEVIRKRDGVHNFNARERNNRCTAHDDNYGKWYNESKLLYTDDDVRFDAVE